MKRTKMKSWLFSTNGETLLWRKVICFILCLTFSIANIIALEGSQNEGEGESQSHPKPKKPEPWKQFVNNQQGVLSLKPWNDVVNLGINKKIGWPAIKEVVRQAWSECMFSSDFSFV